MLQFLMYGAWVTQPTPLNKPTYHVHAMYYFKTEYSENHIAASSIVRPRKKPNTGVAS